ncbi:SGNH/GDSL hydrolase family protein, partial [Streptomyces sp. T21Q-yed]|nr:SGNH/GDSL hydrolase family protein [Streptomyces sp. T21Q-yed]
RAVNTVVHALSERYGALHLHAAEGDWVDDRAMWSADRLHPGERGHRQLAIRFHGLLADTGMAWGTEPAAEPEFPPPTKSASLLWLATAGTAWVVRRCNDLLPQLLRLAATEMRHRAKGTCGWLDLRAAQSVSMALASLPVPVPVPVPLPEQRSVLERPVPEYRSVLERPVLERPVPETRPMAGQWPLPEGLSVPGQRSVPGQQPAPEAA